MAYPGCRRARQDVYDLIGARNAALGLNDTQEPGWWHIRAAGVPGRMFMI